MNQGLQGCFVGDANRLWGMFLFVEAEMGDVHFRAVWNLGDSEGSWITV